MGKCGRYDFAPFWVRLGLGPCGILGILEVRTDQREEESRSPAGLIIVPGG